MLKKSSYLISRFFATTAGSLYGFAIIWWIQFNTSSSTIVGLVNAGFDLTAALSIFYGPLIDKHSFKQTALGASFLQAFWLFLLFFSMFLPNYFLILNCILAILISICGEFYSPADRAILKQSVKLNVDLTNMIAKISFIDQSVNFFGVALAGILLKFISSNYIILICAFLSLLSGGLLFN
ncbi:hypothetical protein IMAU30132_02068 [Lactobacillus helveticus]|nr:MFS transporter [Lactobacillus helveticus]NRO49685.1 hypothetical protein [Lactobacillus helveticus]